MAKKKRPNFEGEYKSQLQFLEQLSKLEENGAMHAFKRSEAEQKISEELLKQKALKDTYKKFHSEGYELTKDEKTLMDQIRDSSKQQLEISQNTLKVEKQRKSILSSMAGMLNKAANSSFFKFLMESDKAVRDLNRNLGLSGEQAESMRQSIQGAAVQAAQLGGSIQDLANIQATYANETGRAAGLAKDAQLAVMEIGLGTGLGVDQAAQLAGQFENLGLNARSTADYVQGVVDTSERMGVNTTKVLKSISGNFKQLQKFTFQQGVKGFGEMAAYAEKFKVDMGSMLDSAEKARTLEGATELAAQLQVMGGEFAKSDPFELLFLSRNDPAKFTKKINEMTKGVATFKKNADGTFESFISPMDQDRLRKVAQSLGMQTEELVEQSRRMSQIQRTRQQMVGTNLTGDLKEAVENAAEMNKQTGRMQVKIGMTMKDVSKLTKEDAEYLEKNKKTLAERAEEAKTFDKVFQDTMMQFKSAFLPVLDGINVVMKDYINPAVKKISSILSDTPSWIKDMMKWGGIALGVGVALSKTASILSPVVSVFKGGALSKMLSGGGKKAASVDKFAGLNAAQSLGKGKGMLAAGKGKALSSLGAGAGIGVAAAGMGAGIMMAAKGFAELAKAMKDLDVEQLDAFKDITMTLSIAIPAAAVAIGILAAVAAPAAGPLIALGGAIALIGAGVGIAAAGIGYMAEGFSTLVGAADPSTILATAAGMTALAGASMMFANPLSMLGLAGLAGAVVTMSSAGSGMEKVGYAFEQIGAVLKGSTSQFAEIKETIAAINSMEVNEGSALGQLASLLSKPLKVEFVDNNATFNATVNLNVDGKKIADSINVSRRVAIKSADEKSGKSGSGTV